MPNAEGQQTFEEKAAAVKAETEKIAAAMHTIDEATKQIRLIMSTPPGGGPTVYN